VYDKRRYDGMTIEQKLDLALELLDEILYAFPDGIPEHRQAHVAWLKAKEAEVQFWQELKLDIAKKGVWGMLVVVCGLILVGLTVKAGVWFR